MSILENFDGIEEFESLVWIALIETSASREVATKAKRRLLARAESISDTAMRKRFLENVPENAAILQAPGL